MKLTHALVLAAAAGLAYKAWHNHRAGAQSADDAPSPGSFVTVEMPDGAPRNRVLILAPQNCPSSAAKRADALASRLTQMGIPNDRSDTYSLRYGAVTAEQQVRIKHTQEVLGGSIPAVFVNGMGKGNPSADEVADVFRSSQ